MKKGCFILDNTNVIDDYLNNNLTSYQLGEKYNCSNITILNYLRKNNITIIPKIQRYYKNSKYHLNEHWLDEIDCQEKAYFLGFFLADGSTQKGHGYTIEIKLQVQDKYILEKFAEYFESDRPIVYGENHSDKGYGKDIAKYYAFRLGNKYLWERMIKLGFPPNKTKIVEFPEWVKEELLPHFIRGIFDGDGNICLRYNNTVGNIKICGTYKLVNKIFLIVKEKLNIEGILRHSDHCDMLWYYEISQQRNLKKFLDWIYKDSSVHLIRKYERYQNFINSRDFSKETRAEKITRLKQNEDKIIEDYLNLKETTELGLKYNFDPATIRNVLKRNNIKLRPNKRNKNNNIPRRNTHNQ